MAMVNLSPPRIEDRGLPLGLSLGRRLKVDPERRFCPLPALTEFGAAERVNLFLLDVFTIPILTPTFLNGV